MTQNQQLTQTRLPNRHVADAERRQAEAEQRERIRANARTLAEGRARQTRGRVGKALAATATAGLLLLTPDGRDITKATVDAADSVVDGTASFAQDAVESIAGDPKQNDKPDGWMPDRAVEDPQHVEQLKR